MTASTVVSFVRNFLCCWRSLAHEESFINLLIFPEWTGKLSQVTLVTSIIGVLQFAATGFLCISGGKNLYSGILDYIWIVKLRKHFLALINENVKFGSLIADDLNKAKGSARTKIYSGLGEIVIGASFVFLGLNSFKFHLPNHPKPVIDALICMEFALVYFLYLMWKTYMKNANEKQRAEILAETLRSDATSFFNDPKNLVTLISKSGYENDVLGALSIMDPNFSPSWRRGRLGSNSSFDKALKKDFSTVIASIERFCHKDVDGNEGEKKLDKKELKLEVTRASNARREAADNLLLHGYDANSQVLLSLVYFLLNLVAGYAYLMGIIAFYFHDRHVLAQSWWVKLLKAGLNDEGADWWGNLIGDFCWTVEPGLILIMAYITTLRKNSVTKPSVGKQGQKAKGSKTNANANKRKNANSKKNK